MCSHAAYRRMKHGLPGSNVEILPEASAFSFANGGQTLGNDAFPYMPFQVPQMKNLGVSFDLRTSPEKY